MDTMVRGLLVYTFLLLVFRIAGKRTLAQTTPFEFVLLLIISETIQQALVGDDRSITTAFVLVITLVGLSIAFSLLKQASPTLDKWLDGLPVVVIEKGKLHKDRMDKLRVDESDILESARMLEAIETLDDIAYAVVERSGDITVIPRDGQSEQPPRPKKKPRS